jgi:HAD superfamily hydrolase (TIGR01509 family)
MTAPKLTSFAAPQGGAPAPSGGRAAPAAKALLFDLDGTLIDSMPHHHNAWIEWHKRHGFPMDEPRFFAETAGRTNAEILADMLPQLSTAEHAVLYEEKEAIYRELAEPGLALIVGAAELAAQARERGLKLAVCTASGLLNMALAFQRFGIAGWVDTVTSPADGLRGKPHPDIFEEAARRLGVAPADCIVFEDAPLGIEAARRAGMSAVALTTTMPREAFEGFDNVLAIVADLSEIDLATLTGDTRHA